MPDKTTVTTIDECGNTIDEAPPRRKHEGGPCRVGECSARDRASAQALIAAGYRSVSNRYRHLARIDREDWLEHMARRHVAGFPGDDAANFQCGMRWATGLRTQAGDFYRRVLSQDTIANVAPAVYDLVRKADAALNEFRAKPPSPASACDAANRR